MNFAFLLRSKTVSSLQFWAYRLLFGQPVSQAPAVSVSGDWSTGPSGVLPVTPAIQPCLKVRRPLRVVRFVENGQPHAHAGRMVISGRMADVCAELDRLAARETAENCSPGGVASITC